MAKDLGIAIDNDTNTRIIIDDIVSWAKLLELALRYMECQLKVCQAYRLSLILRKSHIFPSRFEFVGIDVCADGNRPAQSKHTLLETWPAPETVRDVAKFIGFAQFYSRFIHNFEFTLPSWTSEVGPHTLTGELQTLLTCERVPGFIPLTPDRVVRAFQGCDGAIWSFDE